MKDKKVGCETGLKPGIIDKEVFDREIALCKKLNKKDKIKCGWGECDKCGVIPLLHKLHKGELLEESVEIKHIKKKIFS